MGSSVAFTDLSTNTPTSWQWSYGDATANGTTKNPSHTYNTVGAYTVTLTASNSAGSGSKTKTNYITVIPYNATPVANFCGTPTTIYVGQSVAFTDKSTGNNINSWSWVFGDSNTSTSQNPSHTYYTPALTLSSLP